jgi:hypothetical protein
LSRDDGHHADQAVFAGEGLARHWLLRAAVIGGAALLATWLVALALGALGGFEALPSLPGESRGDSPEPSSTEATKSTPVPQQSRDRGDEESGTASGSTTPRKPASRPAPARAPRSKPAPAPPVSITAPTKPGKRLGTTQASGRPAGSPGNGPGGSGPPGQTR